MIKLKKILFKTSLLLTLVWLCSCNGNPEQTVVNKKETGAVSAYTFETGGGWGYAVIVDGKTFIRQSFIPVVQGNQPFKNKTDASRVSALVVGKLQQHQPPTVQLAELQKLGIAAK